MEIDLEIEEILRDLAGCYPLCRSYQECVHCDGEPKVGPNLTKFIDHDSDCIVSRARRVLDKT